MEEKQKQIQDAQDAQDAQKDFNRAEEAKKFLRDFWSLIDKRELALDIALIIFIVLAML